MTPPRTGRHDREHIVGVALDLLDRFGLPDLTMRRLATELDVQASALYWHFDSKQDLLAAVSDRILARIPEPSAGLDLLAAARAVRDALLTHRDGAEVVMSSAALRPGPSRAQDVLRSALPGDVDDADLAATAVLQFVLGHTTLVQQRMHGESHGAASTAGALDDRATDAAVFEAGISLISLGADRARSRH
ncbi:TetR family transcriptional regulator [Microbacterium azadirachtae]|uniref:Tetracycline repressor protein class E n=1 Tax=Microbacterium azadirachtae TaxID=582680 RepID=A0A0F0KFR3_9MICO|nr:TetR family transcriptional regulator [Microbacterium azadirachtae]KJL18995.1 Tetracycline repressor protein class E [Microbacterium azadirachtae]UXW87472.1 TetR family transcriptional regulator [Microbacterium azadirachtae]SDL23265.1 Tetracyclin repressor, C-terminal all-alpha domain [Microbacterium azadirachtae]SEF53165.1 Tetracyclin repressor, C-terminal all-alpha domain [Microbacterium azadirachtae]SEF53399.1 Tetracyclin repressor, C-terminal all-alpha domain [Microbacterium azadirachta